ncbi:collagen, type I, alpha 1b-like [Macrobrachium nipponense]|uniref:collagen, type I, alpha 1b-like n=1 Tax=Macrobrachium nipponense TaxID=159736 RepID=UPI0030C7BC6F
MGGPSAGPPAPLGAGTASPSARKGKAGTRGAPVSTGPSSPGVSGSAAKPGSGSASRSREIPSVRSPPGDRTAKALVPEFARHQDSGTGQKAGESRLGSSRQASGRSRSDLPVPRVDVTVADRPRAEAGKRSPRPLAPASAGASSSTRHEPTHRPSRDSERCRSPDRRSHKDWSTGRVGRAAVARLTCRTGVAVLSPAARPRRAVRPGLQLGPHRGLGIPCCPPSLPVRPVGMEGVSGLPLQCLQPHRAIPGGARHLGAITRSALLVIPSRCRTHLARS